MEHVVDPDRNLLRVSLNCLVARLTFARDYFIIQREGWDLLDCFSSFADVGSLRVTIVLVVEAKTRIEEENWDWVKFLCGTKQERCSGLYDVVIANILSIANGNRVS